nr:MAG TPA: hypothetical protein [Caudoviricetes sp.]
MRCLHIRGARQSTAYPQTIKGAKHRAPKQRRLTK